MAIVLGDNQYGKAETRLVRIDRSGERHRITDLSVTTTLAGDLAATHYTGDNAGVLPTDSQKNAVFAFAQDGVGEIEDFALRLARYFVDSEPAIGRARVAIEQYGWEPRHLLQAFADTDSKSLQQTLYAMGERVLRYRPEMVEIRLSLPNRHHFLQYLAPFGLDNPGEDFYAADRPYGLIEGTVLREGAPPAGSAWW